MPPAPIEVRLPLQTSLANFAGLSQDQDYSPMLSRPKSLAFHGGSTSSTSIFGGHSPVDNERRLPSLALEDDGTPSERRRSLANASRYKTELCRPFMENGVCKYGEKCQFAHGHHEVRAMARHPKYKTEYCRTFHSQGFCPYGPRCHFIHDPLEKRERCTPTTPRSFSVSSPMTSGFPTPGRSPSPPSPLLRTADEQSFNVRRTHKPVQRQFSSPAAMGRAPASSLDDEVFRRTPPSSPPLGGRFSVSSLQDAIDTLTESPRCPNRSTGFVSPAAENGSPGRRLPVFNTISQGN